MLSFLPFTDLENVDSSYFFFFPIYNYNGLSPKLENLPPEIGVTERLGLDHLGTKDNEFCALVGLCAVCQ